MRHLPYIESVTVHRDGTLSVFRAGPASEFVADVLRDLGAMAGATARPHGRTPLSSSSGRPSSGVAGVTRKQGHHDPRGADLDFGEVHP